MSAQTDELITTVISRALERLGPEIRSAVESVLSELPQVKGLEYPTCSYTYEATAGPRWRNKPCPRRVLEGSDYCEHHQPTIPPGWMLVKRYRKG